MLENITTTNPATDFESPSGIINAPIDVSMGTPNTELQHAQQEELLRQCSKVADAYLQSEIQTEDSRRKALVTAYVTFRTCGGYSAYIKAQLANGGIQHKEGVRRFSAFVKLIFRLTITAKMSDAQKRSTTHRVNYLATALDGIASKFDCVMTSELDVDSIIGWMLNEGGTEAVVGKARQGDQHALETADDRTEVDEAMQANVKALLSRAKELARVQTSTLPNFDRTGDFIACVHVENGELVLLAPFGDKGLADIPGLANYVHGTDLSSVPPVINFFAELTQIASVIPEGPSAEPTMADADANANSTARLPKNRVFAVRDAGQLFVVSLGRAASSVIIEAAPTFGASWPTAIDCMWDTKKRRWFEANVAPEIMRVNFDGSIIQDADKLSFFK